MDIDAETRIVTLLGDPVAHSLSPRMHNAALRHQGVNAVYVASRVAPGDLAAAVEGLRALRFLGANVTIPHKEAVRACLDECSERAEAVGAVNTIVRKEDGRLYGDNTDVAGFLGPLQAHEERLRGAGMLIFGAGGAARAAAYALLTAFEPARLTMTARRPAQVKALVHDLTAYDKTGALEAIALEEAGPAVHRSRLVVNATPLGMHPHADGTPWARHEDFTEDQIAYDLVYNPEETCFLRDAAARGATPVGGLDMLIGQAAAAYRLWTGRDMPVEVVRQALSNQRELDQRESETYVRGSKMGDR